MRGHQAGEGVQGCQKKLGQKSDISRVLGSVLEFGEAWAWAGMGRPPTEGRPNREYGRKPNILLRPGWDSLASFLILFVKEVSSR